MVSLSAAGIAHSGWDDRDCDPIPVHHDHNAHRFQHGKLPTSQPDHCLFCHSLRSLGNALVANSVFAVDTTHAATIGSVVLVAAGRVLDSYAPSRAPPAVLN